MLVANTDWYLVNFAAPLVHRLRRDGAEVLLVSPPGAHRAALAALGARWEPLAIGRRSIGPVGELATLVALTRLLRRERPELVHGFTLKGVVHGLLAARLAGVGARVATLTGLGWVFTNRAWSARALRPVLRALLRVALAGARTRTIVQNRDDAAALVGAGLVDASSLRRVAGSGVDCTRFQPRRAPRPPDRPWTVLLVARLLWDKGVGEFVAAARALRATHPTLRLVVAGARDQGNPAAIAPEQLAAWREEGTVEWLGQVDNMPALLAEVDAVALPSHREGLPRSLIEAAACGLPLVASDAPGCREVVRDGVEGLLVPVGDAAALAAAIQRLAADPALAARLGAAGRERTLREFAVPVVVDAVLAVYRELIALPPRQGAP